MDYPLVDIDDVACGVMWYCVVRYQSNNDSSFGDALSNYYPRLPRAYPTSHDFFFLSLMFKLCGLTFFLDSIPMRPPRLLWSI